MLRYPLSLLLLSAFAFASAVDLDKAHEIDLVRIDARNGQITLCVVLEERIDNRASVDRLRRKLNTYARYARSGRVFDDQPTANRDLFPILSVIVSTPVPGIEQQNLDGIKLQYRYTDITFTIETAEPGSVKRRRN